MTVTKEETEQSISNANDGIGIEDSDLYPERRGQKPRSWINKIFRIQEREELDKFKCEMNVYNCVKNSALVKLMLAALKNSGCEIDIRRHISCEVCDTKVTGGYDPELNQIIVCQNSARSKGMVQGVLSHEMIHMFDYCRNNLDLKSIDHLACTEIRAANLCHCSFLSAWIQGLASPFNVKEMHQIRGGFSDFNDLHIYCQGHHSEQHFPLNFSAVGFGLRDICKKLYLTLELPSLNVCILRMRELAQNCVKDKAIRSVVAARKVSEVVAREAVTRVFDKCYNDLEPVGRRLRRNSLDMEKAYLEGPLYGYSN